MNTILTAPFEFDSNSIKSQLSIKPGTKFETNFDELIHRIRDVAKPKAIFRVSYIDKMAPGTVTIEDITFHSQTMRQNFENIGRVFPFVATCGKEVDDYLVDKDDILKQYWLNSIKMALLQASLDKLRKTLQKRYQLKKLSAMNPGSGDASIWPIEEQPLLFSIFGGDHAVFQEIGVRLLPTYLMVPEMSVSGILFPTETSYHNCQLCQREECPGRRAHFDAELWATIQENV